MSHGGGPLPLLDDPSHKHMIEFMKGLSVQLPHPDAILVISAHWEEAEPAVIGVERPELLYDYYGFPQETYSIDYKAPGDPALADRVIQMLEQKGFYCRSEMKRGLDHGVFIPLKLMYPAADIPVVQLSLLKGLDADKHLDLGRALHGLKSENLWIIGSGFSFHNMSDFTMNPEPEADPENDAFQDWLISVCTEENSDKREELLSQWTNAPGARYCHPREEHLLPLHVCAALAAAPGKVIFDAPIAGKRALAFRWDY